MEGELLNVHLEWVTHYGYPAIFALLLLGIVGLPVPDETLLVFAGYLAFRRDLSLVPTLATAFLGSLSGITVSYGLGRTLGLYAIHRFGSWLHVDDARLADVRRWYQRRGKYALVAGYFLPGVRHLTAYLAGSSQLSIATFAAYAWTGALMWSASFISLGYVLGDEWKRTMQGMHRGLFVAAGLIVAVGLLLFLVWRRRISVEAK